MQNWTRATAPKEAPTGINGGEGEKEVEPGGVGLSWSHQREEETEEIIMTPIREHLIVCAKRIIVAPGGVEVNFNFRPRLFWFLVWVTLWVWFSFRLSCHFAVYMLSWFKVFFFSICFHHFELVLIESAIFIKKYH